MVELVINLDKNNVLRFLFTSFTFTITVLLPILSLIKLNSLDSEFLDRYWIEKVILVSSISIVLGILSTITRFLIYSFPRYSVKKQLISLVNSSLLITFLLVNSLLSKIIINFGRSSIILDFSGIFLLLTSLWLVFVGKQIFDLFDFKRNQNYYSKKVRESKKLVAPFPKNLIKCRNCGYMCRISWRKCPICNSKLKV